MFSCAVPFNSVRVLMTDEVRERERQREREIRVAKMRW